MCRHLSASVSHGQESTDRPLSSAVTGHNEYVNVNNVTVNQVTWLE